MAIRVNTVEPGKTPAPQAGAGRRLLAVIDYAAQPYTVGDLLIFMTGSLVAAAEAGASAIDFAFLIDPSRVPTDPITAALVARDTPFPHLMAALPVLQLNPLLGSFHAFDRLPAFQEFLTRHQERYELWPSREALAERRYLFYDIFKAVHARHRRGDRIPQLAFSPSLRRWAHDFFERHAGDRVPITVNLRNNPGYHAHRNSDLPAWRAFFDRCRVEVPATFVITCAASEMDASLRACPNVVYAKDHHTHLAQDLALVRHAAFHLGAGSGPAAMPIFGPSPYHVVHCDMLAHLDTYQGSLVRSGPTELRYAFAAPLQTFGTEPETPETLMTEFMRMWSSRDWTGGEALRRAGVLGPPG